MLWSAPFAHIRERVPGELLIGIDQRLSIPVIHCPVAQRLVSQPSRHLPWMRVVVDIFGRQSLSISVDHEEAANHSKSILFPRRFWTEAARRHQILSHALRAFFHVDLSPSIYVDSASRGNFTLPVLKHAVRLAAYFAATIFIGALLAPPLFWTVQWLTARGLFSFLANPDFERFFPCAVLFAHFALCLH